MIDSSSTYSNKLKNFAAAEQSIVTVTDSKNMKRNKNGTVQPYLFC
jgi:hypothetical protein